MPSNRERSEHYGALQQVIDQLFGEEGDAAYEEQATNNAASLAHERTDPLTTAAQQFGVTTDQAAMLGLGALGGTAQQSKEPTGPTVSRLQVVMAAESADLPDDLLRIVSLLPPGDYTRQKLTTQLNSAITGHAWGQVYGTVG